MIRYFLLFLKLDCLEWLIEPVLMSNSGYLRELPVFSLDKSLVETRIYLNRRDWNPRIGHSRRFSGNVDT